LPAKVLTGAACTKAAPASNRDVLKMSNLIFNWFTRD
jgi:hypothetical protein